MAESQNEIIRQAISKALADKVNLNDKTEKKKLIETIMKDNQTFKKSSVEATYSKFLKSEVSKQGMNPAEFKQRTRAKYDESLNPTIKDGSTQGVKVENPLVKKNPNDKSEIKIVEKTDFPLSSCTSLGSMMYSAFSITDEDMEDLTDLERKDLGEILKPLLDRFAQGDKATAIVSVGAIFGLFISKKREARRKRKEKQQLENKLTSEELPTTTLE